MSNDKVVDWKVAQRSIYQGTTERARILADNIIKSKLNKTELESLGLIISLEAMIRKERREQKKILRLESFRGAQRDVPPPVIDPERSEPDADDRSAAQRDVPPVIDPEPDAAERDADDRRGAE